MHAVTGSSKARGRSLQHRAAGKEQPPDPPTAQPALNTPPRGFKPRDLGASPVPLLPHTVWWLLAMLLVSSPSSRRRGISVSAGTKHSARSSSGLLSEARASPRAFPAPKKLLRCVQPVCTRPQHFAVWIRNGFAFVSNSRGKGQSLNLVQWQPELGK